MISRFHIAVLVGMLLLAQATCAQRLQDWIKLGDISMEQNDPYGALLYYNRAMETDSTKGEVIFKYAEALRANHNYEKAAHYYLQVYKRERGVIYPHSGFWLATMQMQAGDYAEAKQNWRRVRRQFSDHTHSYEYQKAVQSMRSCDLAMEWTENQTQTELISFPHPVSSDASEMAGFYNPNHELIFTSLRGDINTKGEVTSETYEPQIFIADSGLKSIKTLENNFIPNAAHHFVVSADGKHIAVTTISPEGNTVIKVFDAGTNHQIASIPHETDTAWYSHPAFGNLNEKAVLFFASNRAGGYGMEDIWYVELTQTNALPINAGPKINSIGSEITPFYRKDTGMLYFSSDWHHGFGGYDIFESEVTGKEFGYPQNLKQPFNTSANDLYYSFNEEIKKGTITSNRTGSIAPRGEGCCNDLWGFTEALEITLDSLPEITSLEELNEYLPVTLFFHNDEPDPRTRKEETDKNYLETYHEYIRLLPLYQSEYRKGLNENLGDEAEDAMDHFFINEVDQGVEDLALFTKLLLHELEKGAKIALTVKGFASPLAATDYNVKLTSRRISSLENYLKAYQRGVFDKYLIDGNLRLNKIPFGEYVANPVLSDNPNESDAIYSIGAARERKIEITSVQRLSEDSALAELIFKTQILDFGDLKSGDSLDFAFDFSYTGHLILDSIYTDSLQITIDSFNFENQNGIIKGRLHPHLPPGKHNLIIEVYGNTVEEIIELNLSFEIEE